MRSLSDSVGGELLPDNRACPDKLAEALLQLNLRPVGAQREA